MENDKDQVVTKKKRGRPRKTEQPVVEKLEVKKEKKAEQPKKKQVQSKKVKPVATRKRGRPKKKTEEEIREEKLKELAEENEKLGKETLFDATPTKSKSKRTIIDARFASSKLISESIFKSGYVIDEEARKKSREDIAYEIFRKENEIAREDIKREIEQFNIDAELVESEEAARAHGVLVEGILEMGDNGVSFGFIREEAGISTDNDIFVSPVFIRKFNLKPGEKIKGYAKKDKNNEKYRALMFVSEVNGIPPYINRGRVRFDELTPLFPFRRLRLEGDSTDRAMRLVDLFAPVGLGQRGLIVAPPKSGKTVLLKKVAQAIEKNYPEVNLIVLLIDERPEEVTDMIVNVVHGSVMYSTFDEPAQNHIRIAELALNRARGLVEMGADVVILLDSITRLARAYNTVLPPSGRTLSGGLDSSALHKPKKFLGTARNTKEAGSLTILATALIETGSRMDDVIFEEFKGTGNMELILDRKLSEKRIFPSIDIKRSGTRREEFILTEEEREGVWKLRRALDRSPNQDMIERLIDRMMATKTNIEFIRGINEEN